MGEVTGPISTLSGASHDVPDGQMCDKHPRRKAVARIQGETDSFGCEMHDLCQECLDEERAYRNSPEAAEHRKGQCEWCGASNIVVSSNHKPDRYGVPTESKRSVGDEGVAIYFGLKGKPMAMACDRFDNAAANMRSLGLAIDAMRQLERHGGGTMMERAFSGFAALTAPGESWWDVLQVKPDASRDIIDANFRRLARDRHPDNGGSHDAMTALNEARAAALKARP